MGGVGRALGPSLGVLGPSDCFAFLGRRGPAIAGHCCSRGASGTGGPAQIFWGWFLRVGAFYRDICQLVASLVCETLFKRLNLVPGTPLPLPPTTTAEAASKNLDVLRPSVQAPTTGAREGQKQRQNASAYDSLRRLCLLLNSLRWRCDRRREQSLAGAAAQLRQQCWSLQRHWPPRTR